MSPGPIMLDLVGPELTPDEREILKHPLVGGVILFSRNFADMERLCGLTGEIHALRRPPLLIAVDHEGGRVQRFHGAFTSLPACRCYGSCYDRDRREGLRLAELGGWLMATELLSAGVDFSFAPVLDLAHPQSLVLGDRAFHREPDAVAALGKQFMAGMKRAGMAAVGKHFPGHGGVAADSHHQLPVDDRTLEDIALNDLLPFERLIGAGLPAVMPAHVVYREVDQVPAGFSRRWLQDILRRRLGFRGAVFSDDIAMAGAEVAGSFPQRAEAALAAGCDMVLICNNPGAALDVLQTLKPNPDPASQVRLMRMHGSGTFTGPAAMRDSDDWKAAAAAVAAVDSNPELELGDDAIHS